MQLSQLTELIIFSLLAGSTVFLGALSAYFFDKKVINEKLKKRVEILSMALGIGIMISAISLVLIPEGIKEQDSFSTSFFFLLGTIIFYFFDKILEKIKTNFSQLFTMLLDFIPESIALGTMFILNHSIAIVLSILIAFQNFPESFNAFFELKKRGIKLRKILVLFFVLSFFGLIFSLIGYFYIYNHQVIVADIMVFASGGMLYLIFKDIVPSLKLRSSELSVLFINIGFFIGLICYKILEH